MKKKYQPIENYGIIGNLHTVALISLHGSIDYFCFPRFDSPTIFCSLLDADKGGCFSISPVMDDITIKQLYLPDTAILITRFLAEDGIAEISDFMPTGVHEMDCTLIRKVTMIRGSLSFKMKCAPRFNYARNTHEAHQQDDQVIFKALNDHDAVIRLRSDMAMEIDGKDAIASFSLTEGESACFILQTLPEKPVQLSPSKYTGRYLKITSDYWKSWLKQSSYSGRWREVVFRSVITLKLLTSKQHGSAVAAPTFSLPETIGGKRNWDYRFAWIRDTSFTMFAFLRLGFMEEAADFINWIAKYAMEKRMHLMYRIDGGTDLEEVTLDHLEGYRGSKPVRIGNKAFEQLQLDIYGELIDTIYLYNKYGGAITYDLWVEVEEEIEFVIKNWKRKDHGIWEIRNEVHEYMHSRMMCWVALDRAIKIGDSRSFPYDRKKWHDVRDEIYKDVYHNFWNEKKQAFVQRKGADYLDASVLLMPLMRLISPHEPRWLTTLEAIEKELRSDVLIYRYSNQFDIIDGLEGEEGTFTICSFWYVECLSKSGFTTRAREYFEKMLGYSNHLGLYAEQIGKRGEHLGNFPQAFTHLALISAAYQLNEDLDRGMGI